MKVKKDLNLCIRCGACGISDEEVKEVDSLDICPIGALIEVKE